MDSFETILVVLQIIPQIYRVHKIETNKENASVVLLFIIKEFLFYFITNYKLSIIVQIVMFLAIIIFNLFYNFFNSKPF